MPRKTYITSMPDKTGAFLLASKIIAKHNGNIARVSYNKAVDLHTLFIDVEASEEALSEIAEELGTIGYINNKLSEVRVVMVNIKIPDVPGAVLPILKILDRYDINISYINSNSTNSDYQNFKMGLLIENPKIIKMVLDDISEVYQVDIAEYDDSEKNLDNTIFYIRLANEMQKLLQLSTETTMEFISESNRIMQRLQDKGENPDTVFDYIRRFAYFINKRQGINFKADIEKIKISDLVTLYSIEPPCGSNTYVLETQEELVLIDTGYAIYADEMFEVFSKLFINWENRIKRVYITHADVDHCGLLSKLEGASICLNKKSADSLKRQYMGVPDDREQNETSLGYSKLSRIISGYIPPNTDKFYIIDEDTPEEHNNLQFIGSFAVSDLEFEVFEGSGGHLRGEMVFVCRKYGIVFTGDILVNISGFTPERAEFNSLAPYLLRSVNTDSAKATEMRNQIISLAEEIGDANQKPCIICGGHGPISVISNGKLVSMNGVENVIL
ncbi:MBL fold metallo-hydrolase [Ruminiclostridium herbifermentans]|uniref:MBL fold metallo-hydrolase n=1 Tax=Ruminiclostridium herbifermentans TaxID=2488810 RepID=A0A4U7JI69_9FIRM|nr:MBL fold metallo-hydrolase [Ruminiclostridium herbifermentans]QNU65460.1 MBL fold metallo-hydrolase [Ruminiclostridium herbifermentans]